MPQKPLNPQKHLVILAILLTPILFFHSSVVAQRMALVIGNSSYSEAPLKNPVNDANDISKALKRLDFKVTTITNANKRAMSKAIKKFGKSLNKNDVGLFYFAGHGMQVQGRNYLIPVGSNIEDEDDLEFDAIDAALVLAKMESAGNGLNIVMLDACRNNPFARSFRSSNRGLARMDTPKGSMLVYATGKNAVAADGDGRNGLFTQSLLEHIETQNISLQEVIRRTRAGVVKKSREKQVPWLSSSVTQLFYFNQVSIAPPQIVQAQTSAPPQITMSGEHSMWQLVRNSKDIDELQLFIAQFPKSYFVALANKRIKLLESQSQPQSKNQTYTVGNTSFTMKAIPAGSFMMGCVSGEDCGRNEKPVHKVTLKAFSMMETEVTWSLYQQCIGSGNCESNKKEGGDEGWGKGNRPVINVSFNDITEDFIPWLNKKLNKKAEQGFSLPSEAQWEYAARAGSKNKTKYSWGNDIDCTKAQYDGGKNSSCYYKKANGKLRGTAPVKSFQPNQFGLYDMHGNVWEWTQDCWNASYKGAPTNGAAWLSGGCVRRVLRGGSWFYKPYILRSAFRYGSYSRTNRGLDNGFRLVLSFRPGQ